MPAISKPFCHMYSRYAYISGLTAAGVSVTGGVPVYSTTSATAFLRWALTILEPLST